MLFSQVLYHTSVCGIVMAVISKSYFMDDPVRFAACG